LAPTVSSFQGPAQQKERLPLADCFHSQTLLERRFILGTPCFWLIENHGFQLFTFKYPAIDLFSWWKLSIWSSNPGQADSMKPAAESHGNLGDQFEPEVYHASRLMQLKLW
jgi:hypothetical protein